MHNHKTRNVSETYMPQWCKIQVYLLCRSKAYPKQVNILGSKEWFDLDLWTCKLKINREHLLIGCNPCTKLGIDQVKGSKDIERTHSVLRRVVWPWPLNMLTWKSIGIIYLLRATPVAGLVLIKWRGQTILSGQPTYRPTVARTICPFLTGA